MSNMATIRPLLERAYDSLGLTGINAEMWADAYKHVEGTDITADSVTLALAEIRADRLARAAPNSTDETVEE